MKMKKIMFVTFLLLAVLTIGAASAADNVATDNITASDDTDVIAADDDKYDEYDIWVTEDEEICIDPNDEEYNANEEIAFIEMPSDEEGSFQIWNDKELVARCDYNTYDVEHWEVDEDDDTIMCGSIFLKDLDLSKIKNNDILSFQFFEKGKNTPVDSYTVFYKVELTESYIKLTEYDNEAEDVEVEYLETEIVMDESWNETAFIKFTVKEGIDGRIVIYLNETIAFNKTLSELTEDEDEPGAYTILIGDLNVKQAGTYTIKDYFYDNNGILKYEYDAEDPETLKLYSSQTVPIDNINIHVEEKPITITGNETFITIDSNASPDDEITIYIDDKDPITIKLNNTRTDYDGNYIIGSKELNMNLTVE